MKTPKICPTSQGQLALVLGVASRFSLPLSVELTQQNRKMSDNDAQPAAPPAPSRPSRPSLRQLCVSLRQIHVSCLSFVQFQLAQDQKTNLDKSQFGQALVRKFVQVQFAQVLFCVCVSFFPTFIKSHSATNNPTSVTSNSNKTKQRNNGHHQAKPRL